MRFSPCLLLLTAACGSVAPSGPDGAAGAGSQALTVAVTGGGSVRSSPGGIDCGAKCIAQFDAGTLVTLTPEPDATSAFTGWQGDCTGDGPCQLPMDGSKSATATFAPHGSKRWVSQISFTGEDYMEEVAVDPQGNLIAGGVVDDGGGADLYVVKYAKADGKILWKQQLDTPDGGENLGGLATDAEGNVYLAARLQGSPSTPITYGTTTLTGDLFGNIVVLRLAAADGAVVWARQWGGSAQDIPEALAVSGNDLYVVGNTSSNPSTFDGRAIANSTGQGFIVRASITNGVAAELKSVPASVDLFAVAVNGTHIAVAGQTRGAVTLDTPCGVTPSGAGSDALLIDLIGATLDCQWMRNFGDFVANNNATIHALTAFPGGGWAVAGSFQGNILLATSGTSLGSRGGFDVFTGRFDGAGNHLWSFRYGDTGFDVGYGIAATPEGSILLAGAFGSTITFGTATLTGAANTFVTRMSGGAAPVHEWAVGLGGDGSDLAESVTVAPDGSVYVLSSFTGMTNIAGTPLTSQGYDAWIGALVK
jgi:Divergent InlB B-repeat domain